MGSICKHFSMLTMTNSYFARQFYNLQTCQPERVKNMEIFFSSDKKSGDFKKSSENELI
jgi:hypothetical protein